MSLSLALPSPETRSLLAAAASRPGALLPPEKSHLLPFPALPPAELENHLTSFLTPFSSEGRLFLPLVILLGSTPIGAARLVGGSTLSTSSFLLAPFQHQGLGKAARSLLLSLAFSRLAAHRVLSHSLEENAPSVAISRALGYTESARTLVSTSTSTTHELTFSLTPASFTPALSPLPGALPALFTR